jgi:ribonuclease HII
MTLLCGVDEAGRGPLAGPVFAAAVVLGPTAEINGIADSKKLSAARRDALAPLIREQAEAWAIASASVAEIDSMNILQATMLAMFRAVSQLPPACLRASLSMAPPCRAICDRGRSNAESWSWRKRADATCVRSVRRRFWPRRRVTPTCWTYTPAIRSTPDRTGYGTTAHMAALGAHGPCPEHRRSFAPVAQWQLL